MSGIQVEKPIINSPYDEPKNHWYLVEGEEARLNDGRRPAHYFYRFPGSEMKGAGIRIELKLVNMIRQRVAEWRKQGYPGVSRTTHELLAYWRREGRRHRLFFAQLEAVETIIFLTEGRQDLRQGLDVPFDKTSENQLAEGLKGFIRYAAKMATGTGKTTVMGMVIAWSVLNKVAAKNDSRFSDAVVLVVPNVTIRNRCGELDPDRGDASLYRTRDLVPETWMGRLRQGRILITNWHAFERQGTQDGARVKKTGVPVVVRERIQIAQKSTTARGSRYLSLKDYEKQVAGGLLKVIEEEKNKDGSLKSIVVESTRYVESETAWIERVLGRDIGGKQNILVLNDEAHHAYRIRRAEREENDDDDEDLDEFVKEATIWVDGLDLIAKHRGINVCIDLSATPYYLGRIGEDANKPFPWIISDFGLVEAIEAGLVKIPQLAIRDTTGAEIPGYFNIWEWILSKLTAAERGGKKGSPKPEAVLKYAHTPMAILGGEWEKTLKEWRADTEELRPPVFIVVVKNTAIAKVVYDWLGEGKNPSGIPSSKLDEFRNNEERVVTIRVDSKVVHETDTDGAKGDEVRWMRLTLDTVGRMTWPTDGQGRPIYPEGFEDLAKKLTRPLHPPGRDIRCIVSVGMLTEGWDCNTVTHIVGMRPFQSQLLCEQVVGRGLRRKSYELGDDGLMTEEVAKVFGVPFELIPFKADPKGASKPKPKRFHVHAEPSKAHLEIRYPRVEGYTQAVRNKVTVDWAAQKVVTIDPGKIPPEVEMKASLPNNLGRPSLTGPGRQDIVDLNQFRRSRRVQELVFELATALTRDWVNARNCELPPHVLFPQMASIVRRFLDEKVEVLTPGEKVDLFVSPYYGWVIERLVEAIRPDASQGESPEVPRYEPNRGPGSTAEVDYWTSKDVRQVAKSHVNYVVADTKRWEQTAAYYLDTHPMVEAFVKNAGLGFAIPYLHNGQMHDYQPDFIVRLKTNPVRHAIVETKGFDEKEGVKVDAANRWVNAVNADGRYGKWDYVIAKKPTEVVTLIDSLVLRTGGASKP